MSFISVPFSRAQRETAELLAEIKQYYGRNKRGQTSVREKLKLIRAQHEMERRLIVTEITADSSNDKFIDQMAGHDAVHTKGAETVSDLKSMRLSDRRGTKTAYALVDPMTRDVYAAIYVYRSDRRRTPGMALEDWLPGHVGEILAEEPRMLAKIPNAYVFYSISRFWKMEGEGEMLIAKLHQKLNEDISRQYPLLSKDDITFSTLSPARRLKKWIDHTGFVFDRSDSNALLKAAFDYVTSDQSDLPKDIVDVVRRFHLSNGSNLLSIRTDANFEGTEDDVDGLGVMAQYGYSRRRKDLGKNASQFNRGNVVVSTELEERMESIPVSAAHPVRVLA